MSPELTKLTNEGNPKPGQTFLDIHTNVVVQRPASCSAALALSFLETRQNTIVADKLAIIANMCDYYQRLDTKELQKLNLRLSTCVIALSLMNGDFSLLTQEVYRSPSLLYEYDSIGNPSSNEGSFSWEPTNLLKQTFHTLLYPRSVCQARPVANLYNLTKDGYSVPGLLWQFDQYVDFSSIKEEFSEEWLAMRDSHKVQIATMSHFPAYHQEEVSEKNRLTTTHILFEILNFLAHQNYIGVADAIWQSVFNVSWKVPGTETDQVESVMDFLGTPENLGPEERDNMFYLSESKDGSYRCWWLIDRIMDKGGLWIGSLARLPATDLSERMKNRDEFKATIGQAKQNGKLTIADEKIYTTAIRRKLASGMMRLMSQHQVRTDEHADKGEIIQSESISAYALTAILMTKYLENYQHDLYQLRAVFDIDDPFNMVLTPFNSRLEGIPAVDLRSMSTSWVVQIVNQGDFPKEQKAGNEGDDRYEEEKYQPLGMVQGMWQIVDIPIWSRFTLV
jgi:hypothetical protein